MSRPGVVWMLVAGVGMSAAHAADTASIPATSVAPPAAHWVQRTFRFTYLGFTTHYSCDGLRDNVREVLLALGARKQDLQIHSSGCTRLTGPEPFPGVTARFSVLVPATPDEIGKVGDTTAHATQWQTVDLARLRGFEFGQGQCELLEQLKKQVLPLFTTRNLLYHSSCVPHQVSIGDIQLRVDVLRPLPAPKTAAPAAPTPAA